MRDLDRIKAPRALSVDRQKISLLFATGIVIGITIFTVGLYLGLRWPSDAEAATADPLEELIASGEREAGAKDQAEAAISPTLLHYQEILGEEEPAVTPPLVPAGDVDSPLPVDPGTAYVSPAAGGFEIPSLPYVTAFEEPARIELPKPGQKGVFTVHVNSFSDKAEAVGYVTELRKAGYKAFLVQAETESRGTLWRVRIGPFFSQKEAWKFSQAFEKKEGIPTYIVQRIVG